ncbi:Protein of unknown function [Alteribacillus persepolensis]|uniref:DUF3397 domain-containing protein n=1 Tax=Alteribacillus persepolensis TaxID=568899 RepID=A0A1G7YFX8_9BACI|nr:DUF3397 domain-containing protein [Alteribacillus persepolensis]SDG94790.1 Protein of unknown function [Alteribacillus persepolensis]
MNALVYVLALLFILPFLAWYIVYIITVKRTKRKGKAMRLAADVSAILFIGSVHILAHSIWGGSFFWVILIIILLIAAAFTYLHYQSEEAVDVKKLLKGIWRFTFFVFMMLYFLLLLYGLISYLLSSFLG